MIQQNDLNIKKTDGIVEQNNYDLNKDILTIITPCGHFRFKISDADLLKNADRIAGIFTGEMEKVNKKLKNSREHLSQYARLLLITLNICEQQIKLEDRHIQLEEDLEKISTEQSKPQPANEHLLADHGELIADYEKLKKEHELLRDEYENIKSSHSEHMEFYKKFKEDHGELQREYADLVNSHARIQADLVNLQEEHTGLMADHAKLHGDYADLLSDHSRLKAENTNIHSSNPISVHSVQGEDAISDTEVTTPDTPSKSATAGAVSEKPTPDTSSEIITSDTASEIITSDSASKIITSDSDTEATIFNPDNKFLSEQNDKPAEKPDEKNVPQIPETSEIENYNGASEVINHNESTESLNQKEKDDTENLQNKGSITTPCNESSLTDMENNGKYNIETCDEETTVLPSPDEQASVVNTHVEKTDAEQTHVEQTSVEQTSVEQMPIEPPPVEPPSFIINVPDSNKHVPKPPSLSEPGEYQIPLLSFLRNTSSKTEVDQQKIRRDAELLEKKLGYFGIKGEVMGVSPGPVITTFEYKPDPGIKISKIVNLADDLALALSAFSIRIVAPIPGKDVMGIEIPNLKKSVVPFIDIVTAEDFVNTSSRVPICLGKDIIGNPVVVELDKMPHLLIAGATGTGKSVGLNAMITSILYKSSPDEVKFLMIDPKRIELSFYNDIPHLLTPVITDMKKANIALQWMVREMDRRYNLLAHFQVRNIEQYNRKISTIEPQFDDDGEELEALPFIVVIIDELADLMMTASRDIELSLTRLAQMARAAGIHLILATQRPSVDVLTGIIKANFPTRISFQVSSKTDSRTIIDSNGAETLLGNGDMLFVPPGTARLTRVHGTYLSEDELSKITAFIKKQRKPNYIFDVITEQEPDEISSDVMDDEYDDKYNEALEFVVTTRQASISGIQRALRVGYNRAARIIDIMERKGIVGPSDGIKPRKVLVNSMDFDSM
ncbi:FtsK2 (modular protein) [Desulfamplus magnetovallimortis]|uniref:FtsK2 (Modular protein) n=1 Tax=Desulfamplus magnetovallimortis TaxID=1246637 RepID=A0A1W1HJT7_9BACT|nr:DNA translocase FtsK [Desulfamplus magnetovallimortis]SLM32628.1 FtsK2 (modular protein) [Desulfamplus magnetovallimortis]